MKRFTIEMYKKGDRVIVRFIEYIGGNRVWRIFDATVDKMINKEFVSVSRDGYVEEDA